MPAWRGTFIVSVRRGVPVTPAEADWIIKSNAADPTSRSLRRPCRRGMPVMPADAEWIIQPGAVDPTSGSLRKENWRGHGRRLCERLPPWNTALIQLCITKRHTHGRKPEILVSSQFAKINNSGENHSSDSVYSHHTGPAQHHDSSESGRANKPPLR